MKLLAAALLAGTMLSTSAYAAVLPDLAAVAPSGFVLKQDGQPEPLLTFTTGIANIGNFPLDVHPANAGTVTTAWQWLPGCTGIVSNPTCHNAGEAQYHPAHRHWHMGTLAREELHFGSLTGPIVALADKITFCLIDWGQIISNKLGRVYNADKQTDGRHYIDCYRKDDPASIGPDNAQGISVGFVDQYHASTPGQQLRMPTVPGRYYFVNRVNFEGHFVESNLNNNSAWTSFDLIKSGTSFSIKVVASGGLDAVKSNR